MFPENIHKVYMLGAGGIGMSAIARYFISKGIQVSGYDKTPTPLTDLLKSEGIELHFTDDPSRIPGDADLVIYTPAIPKDLKEYLAVLASGIPVKKRSEILGLITSGHYTIAVAGTHGKTTVSSMIAYIFIQSGKGCTAFLGGVLRNIRSNFTSADNDIYIVEADEFDRSFHQLSPSIAVITSADPDHLDIYGDSESLKESFSVFSSKIIPNGTLLLKKGVEIETRVAGGKVYTYSLNEKADFFAVNIHAERGYYSFDLVTPGGVVKDIRAGVPGRFNAENTVAASSIAYFAGIDEDSIRKAVAGFAGISRRFEVHINLPGLIYIDDYAHHPVELSSAIHAAREMYSSMKITGIFQPHLYTRTRDLALFFAESLDELDEVILLEIYPAREKPLPGVSSELIREKMKNKNSVVCSREELFTTLDRSKQEVVLTLGAGDIDQLIDPVKKYLLSKYHK